MVPDDVAHLPSWRAGDVSPAVARIETALGELGYFPQAPDWTFGQDTARAVATFQQTVGLTADGIVDAATWHKLSLLAVFGGGC